MKKWNIKLYVPGHELVNNIVTIVKDTSSRKTFKVVNLSHNTLWADTFSSKEEAMEKIIHFKNKFLVSIEEVE